MAFQEVFQRIEKKYLLEESQYSRLLRGLEGIAAVDEYGKTTILNIYYDTPDDRLIRRSLEKPVYKEKLRLRSYGVPETDGCSFVELKKKYRGVVYKRRISAPYKEALTYLDAGSGQLAARTGRLRSRAKGDVQIIREIDYFQQFYRSLEPRMVISYDRIAMAGIADPDLRITFDTNLRWRTTDLDLRAGGYGRQLLRPGQVLCELKIAGAIPVTLARMFSELQIYPVSCSKYGSAWEELQREMRTAQTQRQQRLAGGQAGEQTCGKAGELAGEPAGGQTGEQTGRTGRTDRTDRTDRTGRTGRAGQAGKIRGLYPADDRKGKAAYA